jgi:hypothetical protein
VEAFSLRYGRDDLQRLSKQFHLLASESTHAVAEARAEFSRDVAVLVGRLTTNLKGMGSRAPERCLARLQAETSRVPIQTLHEQLETLAHDALVHEFDLFARIEGAFAETRMQEAEEAFRSRVEGCVNDVRTRTNALLGSSLDRQEIQYSMPSSPLLHQLLPNSSAWNRFTLPRTPRVISWLIGPLLARRRLFVKLRHQFDAATQKAVGNSMGILELRGAQRAADVTGTFARQFDLTIELVLHGLGRAEAILRLPPQDRRRELKIDLALAGLSHLDEG